MTSTNSTYKTPEGSRAQVQEKLTLFISDNYLKVLALKGKWGVGKTHLVKTFFEEQKQDYYYGSVFGISSIEQLKSQILANKGATGKILKWVNNQSDKITKTKDITLPNLPTIAGSAISIGSDLLFNLIFNSINGFICIDDLERKSKLGLIEILGFVENLIQQSNCKIILIYNEDELIKDEASKKALEEYREKVIDIEIELNPTVEENFFLAKFSNNDPNIEVIKNTFILARTNNIRVLKKTKWNLDKFQPLIQDWHPKIHELVIRNVVIASLVKLDNNFPVKWGHLLTFTGNEQEIESIREKIQERKKEISSQEEDPIIIKEKQAKKILNDMEFQTFLFQSINPHIFTFIEKYSLDEDSFIRIGKGLSERESKNEELKKYYEIGLPLLTSFKDSTQEITNNVINFLDKHSTDLDISDFEYLERGLINVYLPKLELEVSQYKAKLLKNSIEKLNPTNFQEVRLLESLREKVQNFSELQELLEYKIAEYNKTLDIPKEITRILIKPTFSRLFWIFFIFYNPVIERLTAI